MRCGGHRRCDGKPKHLSKSQSAGRREGPKGYAASTQQRDETNDDLSARGKRGVRETRQVSRAQNRLVATALRRLAAQSLGGHQRPSPIRVKLSQRRGARSARRRSEMNSATLQTNKRGSRAPFSRLGANCKSIHGSASARAALSRACACRSQRQSSPQHPLATSRRHRCGSPLSPAARTESLSR